MKQASVPGDDWVYLAFGLLLCGALVWIIFHYFSRRRRARVEEAKYNMLDDDE